MKRYPRVLIISNQCLSKETSNGRTLRNFLAEWPVSNLAQFCLQNQSPDLEICSRYYCVSDHAALQSFLRGKPAQGQRLTQAQTKPPQKGNLRKKRNAATMLLREAVWNSMLWAGADFFCWIEEFSPEVVLLQAGDCGFMLRLARKLAQQYAIPLVIYNSEAYYFKTFDYFRAAGIGKLIYPVFHRYFCREFEKTLRVCQKSIYSCEKLKKDYDAQFSLPSEVIHTATQMVPGKGETHNDPLQISYLGNLGVGRHEALLEIGEALQRISPKLKLDVYGSMPNEQVQKVFSSCPGICYHGFITYEEVVDIIQGSDILVHAENSSAFYREDLKYAFSTKIADSLASGRCFLLYAPEGMACTAYLTNNAAAWVANSVQELQTQLALLCSDLRQRKRYLANARYLVERNHDFRKNAEQFQKILIEAAETAAKRPADG